MLKQNRVMDIENIAENVLPPRAWMPYKEALVLDGEWDFLWSKGKSIPFDFQPEKWQRIPVPANWEFHGFGKPNYLNFRYPKAFSRHKIPYIRKEENEWGLYRKEFMVGAGYNCRDAVLAFEGVRSVYQVWLNGAYIGFAQGSNTPKEFPVGAILKEGRNELRVLVQKFGIGAYLEDQDMWRLSGIFRPVTLHVLKEDALFDCQIDAEPTEDNREGHLHVRAEVRDPACKIFACLPEFEEKCELKREGEYFTGGMIVGNPTCWNAENPSLYECEIQVVKNNSIVDRTSFKIGFRRIELTKNFLKINGKPILIKGVNRHEFHPEVGHAVDIEMIRADLKLLKAYNVNAIRTSHYPNRSEFYSLCDELGFYVMDEANIETHGLRHKIPRSRMEWLPHCEDRATRMIKRDYNHPSIIFWSMGNEAGEGKVFHKLKKTMRTLDSKRPIHYEGDHKLDVSDIFSTMYSTPKEVKQIGVREKVKAGFLEQNHPFGVSIRSSQYADKPFLLCEFGHAMMNSLGNFDEYMAIFRQYSHILGGFIWDFSDQAIRGGKGELLYGGDFVPEDHDGFFCANGIFTADRKPNPAAYEVRHQYQSLWMEETDTGIRLRNEFSFTDYPRLSMKMSWVEQTGLPREKEIQVNLPALSQHDWSYEELGLMDWIQVDFALVDQGQVIASHQFLSKDQVPVRGKGSMRADHFKVNPETGCLSSFVVNGKEQLVDPMRLNFDRVETANDWNYGNFFPVLKRESWWRRQEKKIRVSAYQEEENQVKVVWKHPGFAFLEASYRLTEEGLDIEMRGKPRRDLIRFGLSFGFVPDYQGVRWHGRGPWENYQDRKSGAFEGNYESSLSEFSTAYLVPMENGNRCDCSWVSLKSGENEVLQIQGKNQCFDFSAWHYRKESLQSWTHLHDMKDETVCQVNIDAKQIGVGGEKPGLLSLHDGYRLKSGETMELRVTMGGSDEAKTNSSQ